MRAVLQRVTRARVTVEGGEVGSIGLGWAVLLGIGPSDDDASAVWMADRIATLRAFGDEAGKMNRSALDVGAQVLLVSQFTLYADLSRGRRPGFGTAAPPALAEPLVQQVAHLLRQRGLTVATGQFGAMMDVDLVNHGPVTLILSTDGWT